MQDKKRAKRILSSIIKSEIQKNNNDICIDCGVKNTDYHFVNTSDDNPKKGYLWPVKIHQHHENYNKPFDTVPLCVRCHRGRHKNSTVIELEDSAIEQILQLAELRKNDKRRDKNKL